MAIWPWYGRLIQGELYGDADVFLDVKEYKNLQAWADKIAKRKGVVNGINVDYQEIK